MGTIVVVGGGMCGLATSMMLSRRGHTVTVLEHNPAEPPESADRAWDEWERPGCGQFRMGHWFLSRFRLIIEAELPEIVEALDAAGALRAGITSAPPPVHGWDPQPDDDRFESITGRRPLFEHVFACAARDEPGVEIRRGIGVRGLLTGTSVIDGTPHVVGVRTDDGETLDADLVIDAGGRRSALGTWLGDLGAVPFHEESEDCGFRYYGRYFRSRDGSFPGVPMPQQFSAGSAGGLVLPADNATWMVGVATASKDKALRGLVDEQRWTRAVAGIGSAAPWLDGDAMTEVETMVGIADRYRRFVIDGVPVATGVEAVGDAWAATNPSLGRGVTMALMQAQELVDSIEKHLDDPGELALRYDDATEREVTPYYRATVEIDRGTLAVFESELAGTEPPPPNPIAAGLRKGVALDQRLRRAMGEMMNLLATTEQAVDDEVVNRIIELADEEPPPAPPTLSRAELVAIAND